MNKLKTIILMGLIILSTSACNKGKLYDLSNEYKYSQDFSYYLKETFPDYVKNESTDKIFILPLSSCTPCVDTSLSCLSKLDIRNSEIIFIGESQEGDTVLRNNYIQTIAGRMPAKFDYQSAMFSFRVNIGKPTLLLLKNNEIQRSITLNEQIWEVFKKSIQSGNFEEDLSF